MHESKLYFILYNGAGVMHYFALSVVNKCKVISNESSAEFWLLYKKK